MKIVARDDEEPTAAKEPTAADLAAIEAEWPAIQADLDLLSVQLELLRRGEPVEWLAVVDDWLDIEAEFDVLDVAVPRRRRSLELDWRRHRREARRLLGGAHSSTGVCGQVAA